MKKLLMLPFFALVILGCTSHKKPMACDRYSDYVCGQALGALLIDQKIIPAGDIKWDEEGNLKEEKDYGTPKD